MLEIILSFLLSLESKDHIPLTNIHLFQNDLLTGTLQTLQPEKSENSKLVITKKDSSRPALTAKAALILDANSGTILYKKNIYDSVPIASLTKLMTTRIILKENDLNEIVTVPNDINSIGGSSMYLVPGEKITVSNLLKGLLVHSGNDAAYSLAIHNAKNTDDFVKKMNDEAQRMGLKSSNFANPMGFDDPENYSTAYDLALLTLSLYQNPTLREIVGTSHIELSSIDDKYHHNLDSTNALLDSKYNVIGFKTGLTEQSGGCFIGLTKSPNPKISIVLGSSERFHDTKILLDWAQNTFQYNQLT